MALHVVGVRHHSPACARLVAHAIEQVRPRHVLVEGPSDMNGRLDELYLAHELPIAIYSYLLQAGRTQGSWAPLCAYSPEWVALQKARAVGATARFIDLPAWHEAFQGVENRYSDRHTRYARGVEALCQRLRVEDIDSLWDRLFEQPSEPDGLRSRLRVYFEELRGDEPGGPQDGPREELMARFIAAAMADCAERGGDVLVVCGGYHAPALERMWERVRSPSWPEPPAPEAGASAGSFLVPYTFHRLDSFAGYESGMPSPEYQQRAWEEGPERAGEVMLRRTVQRLRARKQPVSAADLVAAAAQAQGLQRLRGHAALGRTDVLDGLASALVKDALEAPLPWNRRGRLLRGTDPLLVEIVAAFSGERIGKLAPETPRPPLVLDVTSQLTQHQLTPARTPRRVALTYSIPGQLDASRVLHRLRVLAIPGFSRARGPEWATDGELAEEWQVVEVLEAQAALVEAAAYGATLETAAGARLEEQLLQAEGRLNALAKVMGDAVFVGIGSLALRLVDAIARGATSEPSLTVLGDALARLLALYRHDQLLGSAGAPALGGVIRGAFERGLWLLEGMQGATAPADRGHVAAVSALCDALRYAGERLGIDRGQALAVMSRRSVDRSAPPAIRGAALGVLWTCGHFEDAALAEAEAIRALRLAAQPTQLGDFLVGLFALAREAVLDAAGLVRALDALLGELGAQDFQIALPSLRLAFSYFPPVEKERLARSILGLHGRAVADARAFVKLPVDARVTAEGMELDGEVSALERRFGLAEEGRGA